MNHVNWAAMIWSFVPTSTTAPPVYFVPARNSRTAWPEKSSRTGSWQSALYPPSYSSLSKVGDYFFMSTLSLPDLFLTWPISFIASITFLHTYWSLTVYTFIQQAKAHHGICQRTNCSAWCHDCSMKNFVYCFNILPLINILRKLKRVHYFNVYYALLSVY